jgi:hypothetical protein
VNIIRITYNVSLNFYGFRETLAAIPSSNICLHLRYLLKRCTLDAFDRIPCYIHCFACPRLFGTITKCTPVDLIYTNDFFISKIVYIGNHQPIGSSYRNCIAYLMFYLSSICRTHFIDFLRVTTVIVVGVKRNRLASRSPWHRQSGQCQLEICV